MSDFISDSVWARNGEFDPNKSLPIGDNEGSGDTGMKGSEDVLTTLLSQWNKATCGLEISSAIRDEWFHRLWQLHTQDTSHYHTPVHLLEMIGYLYIVLEYQHRHNTDSPPTTLEEDNDEQAILLSIFFHDAIYNPKSATNEEDSAAFFESFAHESKMTQSLQAKVSTFILATKAHKVSEHNSASLALFLDLDMAVLGKEAHAYMAYASLIRKEFNFVPHHTYCEKRAEVLDTFLKNAAIYGTMLMRQALEERARSNLRNEIALLRKGTIL
jgi:predicted metal-dependent HD superfamily phosphohydrolase